MSLSERYRELKTKVKNRKANNPNLPNEPQPPGVKRATINRGLLAALSTNLLGGIALSKAIIDSQPMPLNINGPESYKAIEETKLSDDYEQTLVLPPTALAAATNRTGFLRLDDGRDIIISTFTVGGDLQPLNKENHHTLTPGSGKIASNMITVVDRERRTVTKTTGSITEDSINAWIAPMDDEEIQLREQKSGTFYRPLSPVIDNGTPYIFLDRNKLKGEWWEYYGTDLAVLDVSTNSPQIENIISLPRPDKNRKVKTSWGVAVTEDDNYNYIYGSSLTTFDNPQQFNTREIRLARVKKGHITDISQWEFLGKNGWIDTKNQSSIADQNTAFRYAEQQAVPIIDGNQNTASTFSAHKIGDKTIIVSKRADIFNNGDCVDAYIANTPYGPFKKIILLDKLPNFDKTIHAPLVGTPQINSVLFYPEAFKSTSPNKNLLIFSIGPKDRFLDEVENNVATYADIPVFIDMQEVVARNAQKA
jgi:hypothetical protein